MLILEALEYSPFPKGHCVHATLHLDHHEFLTPTRRVGVIYEGGMHEDHDVFFACPLTEGLSVPDQTIHTGNEPMSHKVEGTSLSRSTGVSLQCLSSPSRDRDGIGRREAPGIVHM